MSNKLKFVSYGEFSSPHKKRKKMQKQNKQANKKQSKIKTTKKNKTLNIYHI